MSKKRNVRVADRGPVASTPDATGRPGGAEEQLADASLESARLVSASEYCVLAGIRMSGAELNRWCDRNELLAEALGRVEKGEKAQYDPRTALFFRPIWMDAERRWKEAQNAQANG